MRVLAVLVALIAALMQAPCAFAHSSLVRAEPADGAVVAEAPAELRLTFNEPVSPLVMRLIGPAGEVTRPESKAENMVVTVTPPPLRRGTHVLSWRVVSADGHPVGGSLTFSVGEPSAQPAAAGASGDAVVRAALWAAKFVIYCALIIGVGGAYFRSWMMTAEPPWLARTLIALMVCAQLLTPLSVGLQGLDALDLPLSGLAQQASWQAGYDTAYGRTAIALTIAFFAALFVLLLLRKKTTALIAVPSPRLRGEGWTLAPHNRMGEGDHPHGRGTLIAPLTQPGIVEPDSMPSPRKRGEGAVTRAGISDAAVFAPSRHAIARSLSLAGMIAAGIALALSGHASNATPQLLTRPSVFLHVVCAAFWIGALVPLLAALRSGEGGALARFTRAIPYPLAALIVTGVTLAVVQLDRVDALWTTSYGIVLSCKIAAITVLLALAVANRYVLVPRFQSGGVAASRPLSRVIAVELAIAVAILALVALWRFTPPPRALAAAEPILVHVHGERAMAHISITPVRARDPQIELTVLDGELQPLAVKEVTLILANPAAGIEPVRRSAIAEGPFTWRVEGLRIPVAGPWIVRVDLLISDFEKIVLEDKAELPRLP